MSNFLALSPPKTEKVRPKISSADKLTTINLKVIEANKILKENFLFDKKQLAERAKQLEKTDRQEEESELETPPEASETKPARGLGIKMPKSKFLDGVKNFIFTVLIGFAATRLLKFLPAMVKLLKPLASIANFFLKVGGVIVKSLIAFLDAGVKAFDFTRNAVKKTFGEDGVKKFDSFVGNLSKFLNLVMTVGMTAVAVSMAMADQDSGRDRTPDGKPRTKPRRKPQSLGDRLRRTRRTIQTKVGRKLQQAKNFAKNFKLSNLKQTGKNLLKSGMNLFNRVKEGVTGTVKNIITKLDDAAKSFMGSLDNIWSGAKNFGKSVVGKIGDVAKMAMDAPGKLRKMVQNQLSGKIDDILKQNDLIQKLKNLNPKDAAKNIRKILKGAAKNKNILKLREGLKAAKAAKIGGVDTVIAAVMGLLDYLVFKESPINAILRAVGGLLGYTAGFAVGAPFGGVPGFITGMAGAFVGEKAAMLLAKVLAKSPLGSIKDPIANDGRMLVRDPDNEQMNEEIDAEQSEYVAKEFKQGDETLTDLKIGDKNGIDTSTLETEASYEGNKTETVMIGGEEQEVEIGDDGFMTDDQIEELSQGDGGGSDDTTNDLAYKNGG